MGDVCVPIRLTETMKDYSKTKAQLEKRLQVLIARAETVDEYLRQKGPGNWDDNAIESEGDEVLDEVGQVTLAEIDMIRHSIIAIDDGTYGVCAACDGQITQERLVALPEATKCRRCA